MILNNEIMIILNDLENVSSRNEKEELIKTMLEEHPDTEELFCLVFNDDVYGVDDKTFRKVIKYKINNNYDDAGQMMQCEYVKNKLGLFQEISVETLREILDDVKEKSGNDLVEYLDDIMSCLDSRLKKWVTRIILKDLRIGIGLKSVNKVFKKLGLEEIKKFEVQLCGSTTLEDWNDYPCIVEEKYDGFRCVISKEGNIVTMTSRQGKDVNEFLPEIKQEIMKIDGDFILDGEIMAKTFNDIQKRIGRKADNLEPVEALHYRVFDILKWNNLDDINTYEITQRFDYLKNIPFNNVIRKSEVHIMNNRENINNLYKEVIGRKGEGLILKKLDGTYDYGSRKNWFKLKPAFCDTFKVVGFEKGKGKYKDTVGALHVEDESGLVTSKVGSGLTDDIRELLYVKEQAGQLNDLYVDVKYSELSKNQSDKYSLRHPRFDKIRSDKTVADDLKEECEKL